MGLFVFRTPGHFYMISVVFFKRRGILKKYVISSQGSMAMATRHRASSAGVQGSSEHPGVLSCGNGNY